MQHAVAHKAVAHADHHADFVDGLGHRLGRGQSFKAGLFAPHDFEQTHDVGRAEEVGAEDFVGSLGYCGDFVDIERGRVGGQDTVRLGSRIQTGKHLFFHVHVFKHGLDDKIDLGDIGVVQTGRDQTHPLFDLCGGEAAALGAAVVVGAHNGQPLVQKLAAGLEQRDRNPGVGEVHGDAAAHGAGANDGNAFDRQRGGALGHVGDFCGGTFGKEDVALGCGLLTGQHLSEQFLFLGQTLVKGQTAGGLDTVDTALGRLKAAALGVCPLARRVKHGRVHAGHLVVQVAHFLERSALGNELVGKRLGPGQQIALGNDFVDHPDCLGLAGRHRHAAGDHLEGGLGTDQAWQALGAAPARQQPQADLGQTDPGRRHGNPIVAAQRGLQSPTQRRTVDGGDRRLGQVFDHLHGAQKTRWLERLAKLGDVRTGDKGPAVADEHRGDGVVAGGLAKTVQQTLTDVLAQRVHGRVVDGDDADVAISGVRD